MQLKHVQMALISLTAALFSKLAFQRLGAPRFSPLQTMHFTQQPLKDSCQLMLLTLMFGVASAGCWSSVMGIVVNPEMWRSHSSWSGPDRSGNPLAASFVALNFTHFPMFCRQLQAGQKLNDLQKLRALPPPLNCRLSLAYCLLQRCWHE